MSEEELRRELPAPLQDVVIEARTARAKDKPKADGKPETRPQFTSDGRHNYGPGWVSPQGERWEDLDSETQEWLIKRQTENREKVTARKERSAEFAKLESQLRDTPGIAYVYTNQLVQLDDGSVVPYDHPTVPQPSSGKSSGSDKAEKTDPGKNGAVQSKAEADLEHYEDLKAGKIYEGHKGPGVGALKTDKPELRDGDGDTVVRERRPRKRDGDVPKSPIPPGKYAAIAAEIVKRSRARKAASKRRTSRRANVGLKSSPTGLPKVKIINR